MGEAPDFAGLRQTGNNLNFDTPPGLSIDTMMSGDVNPPGTMYPFPSTAVSEGTPGYSDNFDSYLLGSSAFPNSSTSARHQDSFSGPDRRFSAGDNSDDMGVGTQQGDGSAGDASSGGENLEASQPHDDGTNAKNNDSPTEPLPSWSELKTKAGKERKRLPLACIACRRKKIRCSGEKPACKHCMRSRIPCVYKVTTRKAAPRTDYMVMLDKRLKRMEDRVIKIIPKEEQGVVESTGRAVVKPALPPPPPKSSASKKRDVESAFGHELDEWANAPPTGIATDKGSETGEDGKPLTTQHFLERNLLTEGADKLPPKQVQEHLSEVFFDYVYGQSYHLLHKPSFMRKLAQGTVPPVLMLAVCAISARFSNHPEVRTEPAFLRGESWASAARDISLRRYDTPSITILIVYLILGLHEFGTCQGGRSWMFGGMAQRMAYALQLHQDLDHDPKCRSAGEKDELTFIDREIRRRVMWSCFLMDRFNSSGTDRPIFVSEHYIRAQLPIKESYFNMDITGPTEDIDGNAPAADLEDGQPTDARDNMGVAAYQIRIIAIWGKLVNYLIRGGKDRDEHSMWSEKSTFQKMRREVDRWKEDLPKSLHYSKENLQIHASEKVANQFLFLHISYHQAVLFLNRFALPTAESRPTFPKEMPANFAAEAARTAHEAANKISELIRESMDHHVVAPFAGYCAFFSSTVHIYDAFSGNPALEESSKRNLAWNVKFLTKMKKHWGMFHFVTENLRDLYKRHADAARNGVSDGGKESNHGIFQYGDWFDRYPHGVNGTDYEEPIPEKKKELGADAVLGHKSDLQTVEEFFSKMSSSTRASQAQQALPQAQRKTNKRRNTKPDSKQALANGHQQQNAKCGDSTPAQHLNGVPKGLTNPPNPSKDNQPPFQPQQAALPVFQGGQPFSPAPVMPQAQHFLPQLDRQMVLDSYAGVNRPPPVGAALSQHPQHQQPPDRLNGGPIYDPHPILVDSGGVDFNAAFAANANAGGSNLWGDPSSSAWFVPFNMEPPSIGHDPGIFNGGGGMGSAAFDWSEFGGYGDYLTHNAAALGGNALLPHSNPSSNGEGGVRRDLEL